MLRRYATVENAARVFAGVLVLALLLLAGKCHLDRKERFMTDCRAEHSAFDCGLMWDTLMARERAATNGNN